MRSSIPSTRSSRNEAGELILVSCYELGHEPLGLVVPAAVLERHGFRPRLCDVAVEDFVEESFVTARFVGISVPMHTALTLGVRVARRIRRINPGCHICFYGLYAALNRDFLVDEGIADTCLGAEFEDDLSRAAETVFGVAGGVSGDVSGDVSSGVAGDVSGGVSGGAGGVAGAVPGAGPEPANAPVLPRRGALRARHRYAKLLNDGALSNVAYVASTRGCKHRCRHCPLPASYDGRFYATPVDGVMADIAQCVDGGARHVTFADPDFLNGPTHARRIARALHDAWPEVTFDYTAKVEHLARHPGLVEELHALGLFVVSAVESFNDAVLSALAKGHTRTDALGVIHHFRRIGLALRPSLVPFTPWETLKSYVDLLDTVATEQLIDHIDAVQYTIRLLVPPGSLLLSAPEFTPYARGLDRERFTYTWSHPDPRMDALQARVSEIAEAGADCDADAVETFREIHAAAVAALGHTAGRAASATAAHVAAPGEPSVPTPGEASGQGTSPSRRKPPRLTESWFC